MLTNEAEREVFAPVAMWLQAIDSVLQRLQDKGIDFGRVRGMSGAGQQVRTFKRKSFLFDSKLCHTPCLGSTKLLYSLLGQMP